jgi:2-polyprenyl-3-methyl-5-hydroxy-6-metoxy-1,4-benzoquinol methylase
MSPECEACGSKRNPYFRFQRWGYDIFRCPECGLGTTHTRSDFDPKRIYTRAYFNGGRKDGYANYLASESVLRREFRTSLAALGRQGRTGGRLFEIGAAYGFFLEEACSSFDVHGIEPCEHAAAFCRDRGLPVMTGFLAEHHFGAGPFDAVVMFDVIEHLGNPFEVLRIAHRHMSPGSHLLVTTGDWDTVLSRLMGPRWRLITPPQHLFFFSKRSIFRMLTRAGFSVVSFERPTKQVPIDLVLYQAERMLGRTPKAHAWLSRFSLPMNLFDAMRVIATKQ